MRQQVKQRQSEPVHTHFMSGIASPVYRVSSLEVVMDGAATERVGNLSEMSEGEVCIVPTARLCIDAQASDGLSQPGVS